METLTMRQLLITTFGFCIALSADAAVFKQSQNSVLLPDRTAGLEYGITGAYLRADYAQMDYALQDNNQDNGFSDGRYYDSEADNDWGWGFMLGWRIGHGSGLDTRLHYFSFCTDNEASTFGNNLYRTRGIEDDHVFWHAGDDSDAENFLRRATRYDEFALSATNIELAQTVNIGCRTRLRMLAGIAHNDVQRLTRVGYRGERPSVNTMPVGADEDQLLENVSSQSDFNGWGPRVGFDFTYNVANHFGIVGHLGSAFLFGSVEVKAAASRHVRFAQIGEPAEGELLGVVTPQSAAKLRTRSRHLVVPNLDCHLGVDYSHVYESGTILTGELGYWGRSYFGGVADILSRDSKKRQNQFDNITFHGVYFSLRAQL